jgi:membrane-associated phospholipid phosphatase
VKHLPNTNGQRRIGTYTSHLGAAYTLVPISAGFYFLGSAFHRDHFRETGLLAFETLIDTAMVDTLLKATTRRARPLEADGKGEFYDSSSVLNSSWPSGHAINTMALASIFAHEYRHNIAVPIAAYSFAGLVIGARIAAEKHFPGDVLAGSVMGWFIGDYVYAKRHNPAVNKERPISYKILDHFRIGGAYPIGPAVITQVSDGAVTLMPNHPVATSPLH